MTDATEPVDETTIDETPAVSAAPTSGATAVYPFTLREVLIGGAFVLLVITSFLPLQVPLQFGGYLSLWTFGSYLPLLTGVPFLIAGFVLPLVAVALLALRRLVAGTPWRVGSLSVDQFASVAASAQVALYFVVLASGSVLVGLLGLLFSLVFLGLTVFAKFIPPFAVEFTERPVVDAPLAARPLLALPKPAPKPIVVPEPTPASAHTAVVAEPVVTAAPAAVAEPVLEPEPLPEETVERIAKTPVLPDRTPPYWILVPEDRPVVDAAGATLFTITPAAWAAVIEHRDGVLVVRDTDGVTIGALRDSSGLQFA